MRSTTAFNAYARDTRLSVRIRNYKEMGIQDTNVAPEQYDDLPQQPTKNMEVDPLKQPFVDQFEMAEKFGERVREVRDNHEAKAAEAQTESAGAQHTEQSEVND